MGSEPLDLENLVPGNQYRTLFFLWRSPLRQLKRSGSCLTLATPNLAAQPRDDVVRTIPLRCARVLEVEFPVVTSDPLIL